jgi:hypothetical protein
MSWLIDAGGVPWPRKRHRVDRWNADDDPLGYAVSDLGFIHLRLVDDAVVVTFNPYRVSRKAIISAFYIIADEHPRRIALSYGDKNSDPEIVGTVGEAFRRIEQVIETTSPVVPIFAQRRGSLDRPPKLITDAITVPLRAWSDAAGRWMPERQASFCAVAPLKDTVVTRSSHGANRLVHEHWGAGFDFLGPQWSRIAVGKDVTDQPFPDLAKRFALQLRRTLAEGEPRLDEIDLMLSSGGRTIRHRRYTNLLLPWRELGGDCYVTRIRFDPSIPTG